MSQATLSERPYINSNLFSSHYLDERLRERDEWDCDEEAQNAMSALQALHDEEGGLVSGYGEDALINNWIDKVLNELGFGTQVETTLPGGGGYVDSLLFENESERRGAAEVYLDTQNTTDLFQRGVGLVEAKQWDADFTARFSEQRPYRNASHQVKHYLENTPENIQWAILTNGRKWRLYGTKDYETQTYYEVDLPELLESGDLERFKYFYVLFQPEAFRESAGTTFLETVWSESETASQELGEDLQDNVFTALSVLGRGFIETNDLRIDPDDDEELEELKEQSLVLLYRLMFVLYAEARGLIHPEGRAAEDEYEANFSLDELRLEIHDTIGAVDEGFVDEFSEYSTAMWSRLEDLFRLIDEGEDALGIPPYNGGLFDRDEHEFLADHEVSNRYLSEVIYRLSTTQNDEGRYVLADYADLDTRHLGSVYEGLLEHQFRIAPEEYAAVGEDGGQIWKSTGKVNEKNAIETVPQGGLYVVNDQGERKATGAYYTPDYIVTYIVEETVGPLVNEIREDLVDQGFERGTNEYLGPFLQRVTDLKILDPAMGSGHFLTKATGYLSEQVMAEVRDVEAELGVAFDEQHVRREIAKECIYGVDLNGMAVELAKLSMWLETLAADRPLAFLDHHFKEGNSVVGSDIMEVLTNGDHEDGQITLTQAFARLRQRTLEHVMELMQELLDFDNETREEIESMKGLYEKIQEDPLYRRLFDIASIDTAENYGINVPGGAYEDLAESIEDEEDWAEVQEYQWFQEAQDMADSNNFFHWKLEFPEVFFASDGSIDESAGFDAIVGNPPYRLLQGTDQQEIMSAQYPDIFTGSNDIAHFFVRQSGEILKDGGELGFIITRYWLEADRSDKIREYISQNLAPRKIIDFENLQVWPQVNVLTVITILQKSTNVDTKLCSASGSDYETATEFMNQKVGMGSGWIDVPDAALGGSPWRLRALTQPDLWEKVRDNANLGSICEITQGIKTGNNDVFVLSESEVEQLELERDALLPLAKSRDIRRFNVSTNKYVIYTDDSFDIDSHENVRNYLLEYKNELEDRAECRDGKYPWWRLQRPRERALIANGSRVLVPHFARKNRFAYSESAIGGTTDSFIISTEELPVNGASMTALLNSKLLNLYQKVFAKQKRAGYISFAGNNLTQIPIKQFEELTQPLQTVSSESLAEECRVSPTMQVAEVLTKLSNEMTQHIRSKNSLNLSLSDYLTNFNLGPKITDIGVYQPSSGVGDTIIASTVEARENLRIGDVTCERNQSGSVTILASARYKPEDQESHETDQWGYTETDLIPVMRLTDLSETEANLIESFVPFAVDNADGFANFRETATKTMSLIDRLEELTLPDPEDVAEDIERYKDAQNRSDELEEKIQLTDELIDKIVYELYDLTDEEIDIVENAVTT